MDRRRYGAVTNEQLDKQRAFTVRKLNDHRLKPEGLKAQGSGLKVQLQTPYAPMDSCRLCTLFKFKDQPQHRAESRPAKAGGLNLTFRESESRSGNGPVMERGEYRHQEVHHDR